MKKVMKEEIQNRVEKKLARNMVTLHLCDDWFLVCDGQGTK